MNRDWRDRAACVGQDPELFFSDWVADQDKAIRICASCPVLAQCRADALATEPVIAHGIRAGLTGNQRRIIRNPRNPSGRRPNPTYSQAEREEAKTLTRDLTERGVSSRAIAARIGVDKRTVLRWRHEYRTAA